MPQTLYMTTSPLEHLGLRERKKLKTRRAIQEHALRLFESQGYDATTVEQIAEAAEVSPSTFFRYFPTKEDVVTTDEYDPIIAELFRTQPADLGPVEALRATFRQILAETYDVDKQRILTRARIALAVPALRARMWDVQLNDTREMIVSLLSERLGRPESDFELQAFSWALTGLLQAVITAWIDSDGEEDLPALLDRALDFFEAGCPLTPAQTQKASLRRR